MSDAPSVTGYVGVQVPFDGRLLFGQAQAVLVGLAGCTRARAAQALIEVAELRGFAPEAVAQILLSEATGPTRAGADTVLRQAMAATREPEPDAATVARYPKHRHYPDSPGYSEHPEDSTPADGGPREAARLAAVRRYDILDSPPEPAFDRITALTARLLGTPMCIISIVDADRVWFKSHHGIELTQVDRFPGLCASAITSDQPWVVENATTDPRALLHPLVAGQLGVRFYAGAPLVTDDGHSLGTLCVIDTRPRTLADRERAMLTGLAELVMDHVELRLTTRRWDEGPPVL